MALSALLDSTSATTIVLSTAILSLLTLLLYRASLHPLHRLPGPFICRLTSAWSYYHAYAGDECRRLHALHQRHGPVVRLGPNEVSIADGAALAAVHADRGGFLKAPCYANFDGEGHATLFSALDPAVRAPRAKAVLPLFSTASLRAGREVLEGCVDRFVRRLREEAESSRRRGKGGKVAVDVLDLSRCLAIDSVCAYLFGEAFGGLTEPDRKLTASGFVDGFVGLNRFFFLPPWIFDWVVRVTGLFWPDAAENESAARVDAFVKRLVRDSPADDSTYQGRLLKAGISPHETEVQCKDLIFAGTDSTGMNLSTLCWHLAREPEIYSKLRHEVRVADAEDPTYNPQSLPYLDAVVREGLRISMANPTRLPRIVPPGGWSFTAGDGAHFHFPAGTQVGLQIYSLHFDPAVFPDPYAFKPERWLAASPAMQRDWLAFGLGPRQCIARNLATQELFLAVRALAREGVLEGADAVGDRVEIIEWFNSRVVGGKMELVWR